MEMLQIFILCTLLVFLRELRAGRVLPGVRPCMHLNLVIIFEEDLVAGREKKMHFRAIAGYLWPAVSEYA